VFPSLTEGVFFTTIKTPPLHGNKLFFSREQVFSSKKLENNLDI